MSWAVWSYYERKAYDLYIEGARRVGVSPSPQYGVGRPRSGLVDFWYPPKRFSIFDGLFGALPLYSVGWAGLGDNPSFAREYPKLVAKVVTALYLGSSRWKNASDAFVDPMRWVRPSLVRVGRRWITEQMRGHRGLNAKHSGYDLPEPIPLSQVIFEEFGVNPLSSASDLIYTEDQVEEILKNGWYPRDLFRNVMSLGGRETDWRGVKVLCVREDFVPRVPISALPFDHYAVDVLYGLYDFVNKVWEDPSILDDVKSLVVYRRNDLYRDSVSLPVILPDFGFPWGVLLFYMTWYVMSKYHHGIFDFMAQSTKLADMVESSLATYTLFPAVAPYKPHATLFGYMVNEVAKRVNVFYEGDMPPHRADSYGDLGLISAWRYNQVVPSEVVVDRFSSARGAVQSLKNWLMGFSRNWLFGFGYLVKEDDSYFFYFGDPLTGYAPNVVMGYNYERMGWNSSWFNYRSVPFFEFMRKFMFLVFEMWRRHGEKVLGGYYVRGGRVDLDAFFGLNGVAFKGFPEHLEIYEDPSQFREIPFRYVFNMAMSIFPAIMYADVLPFRVYHYLTTLYHWHVMHSLPNIRVSEDKETGEFFVSNYDVTRLYAVIGWSPRITYFGVSKAYVGVRRRRFSGELFALGEDSAYSVWNSWYVPGIVLMRFPFYDATVLEFQIEYFQNLFAIPNWSVFDATGGDRSIAFFDESTLYFIPYGRLPIYFQKDEGVSPAALLLYGYDDHLLVWVARAFSGVSDRESLAMDILKALSAARGVDSVMRLRRYLRGRAKDCFDRCVSELGIVEGSVKSNGEGL